MKQAHRWARKSVAMNVNNKTMQSTKSTLSRASVFYLLIAMLVDFGLALFPVWSLTSASRPLEHVVQLFRTVVQETANQPREIIAIFWLPFGAGVGCLAAMLASFFVSSRAAAARAVIVAPLAITIGALLYFLVTRADIHILAISLLPLAAAWWEHHKRGKPA